MNSSSIARAFAFVIALCFTALLVFGVLGRGEDSLRSVFKQAQADSVQHMTLLARAGLPQ